MPAMTAREFVDTIAVPTVEEFKAEPTQRRGYLACLAAYHVADYLKPAGARYPDDICAEMERRLGAPSVALQRMATAVKHREKTAGGMVLMQSGSDTPRPATGFGTGGWGESMNRKGALPGNPLRMGDKGGRYIEHDGRHFDMLDLCIIVLRGYAEVCSPELDGSAIDGLHYNPAKYDP